MLFETEAEDRPVKRSRYTDQLVAVKFDLKPLGKSHVTSPVTQVVRKPVSNPPPKLPPVMPTTRQPTREEIAAIIAAASAVASTPTPPVPEENEASVHKTTSKPPKKSQTKEEKEANKEKRLMKLVGSVVVKCMSKYQKQMDTAQFKKHAKEVGIFASACRLSINGFPLQLTQIITDKEKKSSSYKEGKLDSLSDEKVAKIKKFSKDYIARILRKMEKSGDKRKGSSSSAPAPTQVGSSKSAETPNLHDAPNGAEIPMADSTAEEAMDLEEDSGSDAEVDEMEEQGHPEQGQSPRLDGRSGDHDKMRDEAMEIWAETTDPRPRPPNDTAFDNWDKDRDKGDVDIFSGPTGSALSIGS